MLFSSTFLAVLLKIDPKQTNFWNLQQERGIVCRFQKKNVNLYYYRWKFWGTQRHTWNLRSICGISSHQFFKKFKFCKIRLQFSEPAYIRNNWLRSTLQNLQDLCCRQRFCMQNPRALQNIFKDFYLDSSVLQKPNCALIQYTIWSRIDVTVILQNWKWEMEEGEKSHHFVQIMTVMLKFFML